MGSTRREILRRASWLGVGGGFLIASLPFIRAMMPSERTKSEGGPVEVGVGKIPPGKQITARWRGKPVWILHRTEEMLSNLPKLDSDLRDPALEVESQQPDYARNGTRSINPRYFVCIGICTHLGCVPTFRPDPRPLDLGTKWLGGYFCPCHGSRFDLAGRVYRGVPAPTNLVVPPHRYLSADTIVIGEDAESQPG